MYRIVASLGVVYLLTGLGWAGCDDVIDDGGHLFKHPGNILSAAEALGNDGAMVRVRTFHDYQGAGNLDQLIARIQQDCPSWQAPSGGRKNNLIVLAVSLVEHQMGLYYGGQYNALGTHWLRIQ